MEQQKEDVDATRLFPASTSWGGRPRLVLLVWAPMGISEVELPESGVLQVGRSASCAVAIVDPSVSRVHAEISIDKERLMVKDLGGRNGTFVNDQRISGESIRVRPGDSLRFGNAQAQLQLWTRPFARSVDPVPEESFANRLMVEGERCVRLNSSLSLISVEIPADVNKEVMPEVKEWVREAVRATDVVNVGGRHQFDALLPECGKKAASATAQRIQQALEGHAIKARLGVATFPGDAPSPDSLRMAAQMAIRKVSGSGMAIASEATRVLQIGSREVLVADPAMARLFGMIERIAATSVPVLVRGETGSGKEIIAEAIHSLGPRCEKPMVKLNCAAVPENLLESELFGYERGAFSGAANAKPGLIEEASGGTLFLDEIGEMPLALQAKLLRVLEDRTLRRLGSVKDTPIDLRVVAATHRKLEAKVKEGTFREDLFYRLNAFTLEVPPLRQRRSEIPLLAARFVVEESRIAERTAPVLTDEVNEVLLSYQWPGNVRELRSVIRRAVILSESEISLTHLPPEILKSAAPADDHPQPETRPPPTAPEAGGAPTEAGAAPLTLKEQVRELERQRIVDALQAAKWNQTRAAEILKIPRRTLVSKMTAMGIESSRGKRS